MNLRLLTPEQHECLRSELTARIARRLYPHMLESQRPEAKADARNTAQIEAGRIVRDVFDVFEVPAGQAPRPTLDALIAAVK